MKKIFTILLLAGSLALAQSPTPIPIEPMRPVEQPLVTSKAFVIPADKVAALMAAIRQVATLPGGATLAGGRFEIILTGSMAGCAKAHAIYRPQ